nr:unnamed protein product [Callosobruchus chinensis]
MVVRTPKSRDPNSHLYDFDDPTHVIMINGWMHQHSIEKFPGLWTRNTDQDPVNLLINGRGKWINPRFGNVSDSPFEIFHVEPGNRYRFRMINAMSSPCGCVIKVEGHIMTVIATDGENVQPRRVDAIASYSGERYDFILETNQAPGDYWVQFWATDICESAKITQFAILRYKARPTKGLSNPPSYQNLNSSRGLVRTFPYGTFLFFKDLCSYSLFLV